MKKKNEFENLGEKILILDIYQRITHGQNKCINIRKKSRRRKVRNFITKPD